jgi:hypothetical protein
LAANPILDRDRSFTLLLAAQRSPLRSQAIDIAPVDAPVPNKAIASKLLANFFSPVDKCKHQRRAKQVM